MLVNPQKPDNTDSVNTPYQMSNGLNPESDSGATIEELQEALARSQQRERELKEVVDVLRRRRTPKTEKTGRGDRLYAEFLRQSDERARLIREVAVAAHEAVSPDHALRAVLECICTYTRWPVGHVHVPAADNSGTMVPAQIWYLADPDRYNVFRQVTNETEFPPGVGLPGRVFTTGRPAWITDVTRDSNFPRARLADDIGVRGAFGFPVFIGSRLEAVLEFFTDEPSPPDDDLLDIMTQVGVQFGAVLRRKHAEEAVRRSETHMRQILENALDAVICIDSEGIIVEWTPRAEKLFGISRHMAMGAELADTIIPERYRDAHRNGLRRMQCGQPPKILNTRIEIEALRNTGEEFPVELTITMLRDRNTPMSFAAFVRDITERRMAEKQIQQLNDDLEERVGRRTAELRSAQQELVEKERLAVMGRLIAVVSHELRSPLGTLRNVTFTLGELMSHAGNDKTMSLLERADRSITRCDGIIDELLNFTRTSAPKRKAMPVDAWLMDVVRDYPVPDGIKLTIASPLPTCRIRIDPERMRRCLVNLIANAAQAIETTASASPGKISIRATIDDESLMIRVADNGPGIPENQLGDILKPLYSTRSNGFGLGLAIVKQIVEQHDGELVVESLPGSGATVKMMLPLSRPENVATKS